MNSPIVLFVYKRLDTLVKCIESLQKDPLSKRSDLYIFSDAAGKEEDVVKVNRVRLFIKSISGFNKIVITEAKENKGLAASVIGGVSHVIEKYGNAIVLEDDLVVAPNFLSFMNQSLEYYQHEKNVITISGFTLPVELPQGYAHDVYFTKRVFSWGWATWKDKWESIDWSVADYESFVSNPSRIKTFNEMGSDLSAMLHKQMNGQINSWAIRLYYHQFKNQMFTVFPINSKVLNIGFTKDATHMGGNSKRYRTFIKKEDQTQFVFTKNITSNYKIVKQIVSHFTIPVRAYYKMSDSLAKVFKVFS